MAIPLGRPVAKRLVAAYPGGGPETGLPAKPARRPYLALLPVGFALPPPLPVARCALTAPFHPLPAGLMRRAGGLLSVALSLGSPPPGVTRHRVSVEPRTFLSPAPKRRQRPSGHLAPMRVVPPATAVKRRLGRARSERMAGRLRGRCRAGFAGDSSPAPQKGVRSCIATFRSFGHYLKYREVLVHAPERSEVLLQPR